MTHVRTQILWDYVWGDKNFDGLRTVHDEATRAIINLEQWGNTGWRGGSAMPRAYQAIREWIRTKQGEPTSVYSCLTK